MIKLHGEFKRQKVATISILEGPDKGWSGEAIIFKNQRETIIAKANNQQKQFPSGQYYYPKPTFILL